MATNVIQFPADRCRRPALVVELDECDAHARATDEYTGLSFHGPLVCAMTSVAQEGVCFVTAAKAAAWLLEHYGMVVHHMTA